MPAPRVKPPDDLQAGPDRSNAGRADTQADEKSAVYAPHSGANTAAKKYTDMAKLPRSLFYKHLLVFNELGYSTAAPMT
jgi:hypothetical protein